MAARKFHYLRPCSRQQNWDGREQKTAGQAASPSRRRGLQSLLMFPVLMATMFLFAAMTGCGAGANSAGTSSSAASGATGTSNTPPPPPTFELITPTANETVKGTIELAVNAQSIPALDHIQFILNGRILYNAGDPVTSVKPPYTFFWSTFNANDGNYSLFAQGFDANGNVIKTSSTVNFTVANGSTTLAFTSPDPTQKLSGVVNLSLTSNVPAGDGALAKLYNCFIDGASIQFAFLPTTAPTFSLDTTQFPNGNHDLLCTVSMESNSRAILAQAQTVLDFENGRVPMELRGNFGELHMVIGDNVVLQSKIVNTNLEEDPQATATFQSADSTIATVANDGTVTAVAPGLTTITVSAAGKTRTVQVIVDDARIFPHFSKGGQVLTAFSAGQSMFLRTLFFFDSTAIINSPSVLNNSGINAFTSGFYFNAGDNPANTTYDQWLPSTDSFLNQIASTASSNNLSIFLTGDDIDRSDNELFDTTTNPDTPAKIQHVFNWAANTGRVVGVDMVDEADAVWGTTPTPTNGAWLALPKPIPDTAFTQLVNLIDAVPGHTPISFPVTGAASNDKAFNWEGRTPFGDFASVYFTFSLDYIAEFPYSYSINQVLAEQDRTRLGRLLVLQRDKPLLLLVSSAGPAYTKEAAGGSFTPGQDLLENQGNTPEDVGAQIMYAAAKGFAGVRVYGYDGTPQKNARLQVAIGSGGVQTFADPTTVGVARWNSMAAAFRLLGTLEPFVLQSPTNAEDLGPTVYTGAKSGPTGNLLIAINSLESPQTVHVDLTPYLFPNNCSLIQRYRLASGVVSNGPITGTSDAPLFAPGESIAWAITKSPSCP